MTARAVQVAIGMTFGRWTVIGRAASDPMGRKHWFCRCECGTERRVGDYYLHTGHSTSCGRHPKEIRPKTFQRPCKQCGNLFRLPNCRAWRDHYCSRICLLANRSARKNTKKRECIICGKSFYTRPNLLRQGLGNSCSARCRGLLLKGRKQTPEAIANRLASWKANPNKRVLRGADSHKWKGGRRASYERMRDSGALAARLRRYRKANPHKLREWGQRRRSGKTGRLPQGTVAKLFKLQRGRCAACKGKLPKNYHVDHVMPIMKGGKHKKDNVQLLCPTCNTRKSAKLPEAFMRELGYLL